MGPSGSDPVRFGTPDRAGTLSVSVLDRVMRLAQPRPEPSFVPEPRRLAEGLHLVERRLRFPGGASLPSNTTILSLRDGGTVVISPPPFDGTTRAQVEAIGPPRTLVAPNTFHHVFLRDWSRAFPDAAVFFSPGLPERIDDLPLGGEIDGQAVTPWGPELEWTPLRSGPTFSEVAFHHVASRTLVLTDLAFHMVRIDGLFQRIHWRAFGVPARFGPSRTARWMLLRNRRATRPFLEQVLAWPFERIVVAHGTPLEEDAHETFRRAFARWL